MATGGSERAAQLERFRADPVAALTELARSSPGVGRLVMGTQRCHVVSDPELASAVLAAPPGHFDRGPVLVRSRAFLGEGLLGIPDGDAHRRARRLIGPSLRPSAVRALADPIVDRAVRMQAGWSDGQDLDAYRAMAGLTTSIVFAGLLGVEIDDGTVASFLAAVDACMRIFDRSDAAPVVVRGARFGGGLADLDRTTALVTSEGRRAGRGGVVDHLVAARDDGRLSDRALRDHVLTLAQTGHEPLAVALGWTWYLLSRNPDVRTALHAELDGLLGSRVPTADDVPRLSLTTAALAESLRLFPPVWVQERRVLRDTSLLGERFPAGDVVFINRYAMGRDPKLFAHPERFDPARWTEGGDGPGRDAFHPFGTGPRACLGEALAWFEGTLVLATVASRWTLDVSPEYEPAFAPRFALLPSGGIPVTVHAQGTAG